MNNFAVSHGNHLAPHIFMAHSILNPKWWRAHSVYQSVMPITANLGALLAALRLPVPRWEWLREHRYAECVRKRFVQSQFPKAT
jgi:hypothetical protein